MNRNTFLMILLLGITAALLGVNSLNCQLIEDERNTINVVEQTKNSVVFITNIQYITDFFPSEKVTRGSGSGFVWDNNGHIVTNYHVIEDGDLFNVTLPNQEQRQARLIGKEEAKDIAVLHIEGDLSGLFPLTAGSSRNLQVGQKVIAIGNPFGFDHTVTTGIISATGRKIKGAGDVTIQDMIQTDASINPGNSGGPLLNSSGELVGMNTMIVSPSGAYAGIGFAVPVDTIKKIVPQIIQHGKVIRPDLGIDLLTDNYARRFGIEGVGVVVVEVKRGTAAYQAGLRGLTRNRRGQWVIQDIIVRIDDNPIKSWDDLYNTLDKYQIGDRVTLTVKRDRKDRKIRIKLVKID